MDTTRKDQTRAPIAEVVETAVYLKDKLGEYDWGEALRTGGLEFTASYTHVRGLKAALENPAAYPPEGTARATYYMLANMREAADKFVEHVRKVEAMANGNGASVIPPRHLATRNTPPRVTWQEPEASPRQPDPDLFQSQILDRLDRIANALETITEAL